MYTFSELIGTASLGEMAHGRRRETLKRDVENNYRLMVMHIMRPTPSLEGVRYGVFGKLRTEYGIT